jgi:hypothetical protein
MSAMVFGGQMSRPGFDAASAGRRHVAPTSPFYDSLNCRLAGNWPFGITFAISGDSARHHVYVGSGGGVFVADIANPAAPRMISERLHTLGKVADIAYDGTMHRLYVATGTGGLEVWDLTNDSLPVFLGRHEAQNWISYVALNPPYAFVTDGHELHVIDASNPADLRDTGHVTMPSWLEGIDVSGSCVYAATYDSGLCVVDVSAPDSPQIIGRCPLPGYCYSVTVKGGHAFVGADTAIQVVNIQTPSNPTRIGGMATQDATWRIRIADTLAYLAEDYSGLRVVDIATPSAPHQVDSLPLSGGSTYGLVLDGHSASLASAYANLIVADVTPGNVHQTGTLTVATTSYAVAAAGSYAYLAHKYVSVIDVSNPALPVEVARCSTQAATLGLIGHYLYANPGGIRVYDVSTPAQPHYTSSLELGSGIEGFAVDSPYACAATYDSGFAVIDVSDPSSPHEVGHCHTPHGMSRVAMNAHFAYVNHQDSSLYVISLADPTHPVVVSRCSVGTGSYGYDVAAAGHFAYTCGHDLCVVDVRDSAHPEVIGRMSGAGAVAIRVAGAYAYLAGESRTFQVCDVSDSSNPTLVAYHGGPNSADGIAVIGNLAYLSDDFCGLQIYDVQFSGMAESVRGVVPGLDVRLSANPVRHQAALDMNLSTAGPVAIDLFNLAGQKVAGISRQVFAAGRHTCHLSLAGLSAGAYLVRVQAAGRSQRLKLVIP